MWYKPRDEEMWRFIEVTSGGGKVSGKYKDCPNVKDTVTNEQMCINWKLYDLYVCVCIYIYIYIKFIPVNV